MEIQMDQQHNQDYNIEQKLTQFLSNKIEFPKDFICPLTNCVFSDPVICEDGVTYERTAIVDYFKQKFSFLSPRFQTIMPSDKMISNITLKDAIDNYKLNEMHQQFIERYDLVVKFLSNPDLRNNFYDKIRQLIEQLSEFSQDHDNRFYNQMREIKKRMLNAPNNELFAIFYSNISSCENILRPNEKGLLNIFVNYLHIKLSEQNGFQGLELFSLSDHERSKLLRILQVLQSWERQLAILNSMNGSTIQGQLLMIENYSKKLVKQLKNNDLDNRTFIIPSGFKTLKFKRENNNKHVTIENEYLGQYSTASIIETTDDPDQFNFYQIDPKNPYSYSYCGINENKVNIYQAIKQVPKENITEYFLTQILSLRYIKPEGAYEWEDLYEVVLPKLEGQGELSQRDFITLEEKGFYGLSWALIKQVFAFYLIKELENNDSTWQLYHKLLVEFQLQILANYDLESVRDYMQTKFLLNEMCSKIAFDVSLIHDKENYDIDLLIQRVNYIHSWIKNTNKHFDKAKVQQNIIKTMEFQRNNFSGFGLEGLKGLKFVKDKIKSDINIGLKSMIKYQSYTFKFDYNKDHFDEMQKMFECLQRLKNYYGLNRALQISVIIEEFVFQIITGNSRFSNWYKSDTMRLELSCSQLFEFALLYYNCWMIIQSERGFKQLPTYDDPTFYTKLVLIEYSLFAMMEEMVRKDTILGKSLEGYSISTTLNIDCKISSILKTLVLPSKQWFQLVKGINEYFQRDFENCPKMSNQSNINSETNLSLFHYQSVTLTNESNKSNVDVQFLLNLYKNHFQETYEKFEQKYKGTVDSKMQAKWYGIFDKQFMPKLLYQLMQMSYLARGSLVGYKSIDGNRSYLKYEVSSRPDSFNSTIIKKTASFASKIDFKQLTNYHIIYKQGLSEKYQNIITPFDEQKQDFDQSFKLENEVISKQGEKPDNLILPQYYRLALTMLFENLKLTHIYIGLKNEEITLDVEEQCLIIKQALFKLNDFNDDQPQLQWFMDNEQMQNVIVIYFIKLLLDSKERFTQTKVIGHLIDIAIFIYDFCNEKNQVKILESLLSVRQSLTKYLFDNIKNQMDEKQRLLIAKLSALVIILYKFEQTLSDQDIITILKLRTQIDISSKLQLYISQDYYYKIMEMLYTRETEIIEIIRQNLGILNECTKEQITQSELQQWKENTQLNIFELKEYQFVTVKGQLYINGQPFCGLPPSILSIPNFEECFGRANFLVKFNKVKIDGQIMLQFNTIDTKDDIRITYLDIDLVWIEVKQKNQQNYQTYISQSQLKTLPTYLLYEYVNSQKQNRYTHWYENDVIYVQDSLGNIKYQIDLNNYEILSKQHNKEIIPFVEDIRYDNNDLLKQLSRFEDPNFIIALKNQRNDVIPSIIILERFNLQFKIVNNSIISMDFKDYCLSPSQHISTLSGFDNYLILDEINSSDIKVNLKQILIIPFHPIMVPKKEQCKFYNNQVNMEIKDLYKPAYFSYTVNKNLKCLNTETVSGTLFLALLYLKSASLDTDPLYQMNGYEVAYELLSQCWQNYEYTDEELNILLQFFDYSNSKMLLWYQNEEFNFKDLSSRITNGNYPKHRNVHSIYLKLFYLLSCSQQIQFMKPAKNNQSKFGIQKEDIIVYTLNFYLLNKNRISLRCQLTKQEEKKVLEFREEQHKEYYYRVNQYKSLLVDNKGITLRTQDNKNYQTVYNQLLSANSNKKCDFHSNFSKMFKNKFSYGYSILYNKDFVVSNGIYNWVSKDFDIQYFLSLYRIAINIQNTNSKFSYQSFSYLLLKLYQRFVKDTNQSNSEFSKHLLKMLNTVAQRPENFKDLPNSILTETGQINSDIKFSFSHQNLVLSFESCPYIRSYGNYCDLSKPFIRKFSKYTDQKGYVTESLQKIKSQDFKEYIGDTVLSFLKERRLDIDQTDSLVKNMIELFKELRLNKELHDFLFQISEICDATKYELDYRPELTTRSVEILTIKELQPQDLDKLTSTKISRSQKIEPNWIVQPFNIDEYNKMAASYFEIIEQEPEKLDFALNVKKMPGSLAKQVFNENYGKNFVTDLLLSFDSEVCQNIVLIDGLTFMFGQGVPIKQVIEHTFSLNFNKEILFIENNASEFQSYLTVLIGEWIQYQQEKLNIQQDQAVEIQSFVLEHKEKAKQLSTEIHSFLQTNNVIRINEFLKTEQIHDQLQQLTKNIKMKRLANEYLNRMNNLDLELEEFINDRGYLYSKYFEFILQNQVIPLSLMKLICQRNNIEYSVYKPISPDSSEFVFDEQNSNIGDRNNEQIIRFIYKPPHLHQVLEEVKDEKLITSLKKTQTIGYLQTKNTTYQLKQGLSMHSIKTFLNNNYKDLLQNTKDIWREIKQNIQNVDINTLESIMFRLGLISGQQAFPSKRQVLQMLTNVKQLKHFNPFTKKRGYQERIMTYLVQETLIQQIERVIQQIFAIQTLDQSDKDELIRIQQQVFQNTLAKRSYNLNEFPEWLLFEIENNILIRDIQSSLIKTMMDDQQNCFYQLNMGEGKTSVILILLAHMLANGKNIVRINCLEPLMGVMTDLIKNKFNGFLQKKVFIMPFQRNIDLESKNLNLLCQMLRECQEGKHIFIMTPEQRLCFQLKKQEIFLEYLQLKDADGTFNWEKHFKMCNRIIYEDINNGRYGGTKSYFQLTDEQKKLKSALISLGYLNYSNKILKYPQKDNNIDKKEVEEFVENVSRQLQGVIPDRQYFIRNAYDVLKYSSPENKKLIEEKISILDQIDEFKFFDILDESDEILRHGKELNYTLGQQRALDGGKIRWEIPFIIFNVLFTDHDLIKLFKQAAAQKECPIIFQPDFRPRSQIGGGIPMLRFIDKEFFESDIKKVVAQKLSVQLREAYGEVSNDVIDENGENYGTYNHFLLGISGREEKIIEFLKHKNTDMMNSFILAKAWLSHELFFHVMSYRYRVEYGLSDKDSKQIAIPFKGKDLPSEKSEFSHPDIMIGFTIMSYLYKGLSLKQIQEALVNLKSDVQADRDSILSKWTSLSSDWIRECCRNTGEQYPYWLESFKTFDIENEEKMQLVHKYLSRNQMLIEYYLGNYVFPQEARHFDRKLTGNAHSLAGEGQCNGFSGTDDKNDTLPDSIVSKRLPSQESTNGKMIHILSRKVNNKFETKKFKNSQDFLMQVCKETDKSKDCYILIDAGAIITEMNNFEVAKFLITNMPTKIDGIIYLDDKNNKLRVILRNFDIIPLSTCHIDKKRLFVYLDEVHTRGVDIKLPLTAQGIVTLGKGMNKDKLMQSVMRLRDLDQKQSVVFWGSDQIAAEIAKINGIDSTKITSIQVIIWVTYNTILKNQKDLYAVTLEKLHYVIKKRAQEYQHMVKNIPLSSLIKEFETNIPDSIEFLYGKTPVLQKPSNELNIKMFKILQNFYSKINQEMEQVVNSHENQSLELRSIAKQIEKNEENEDRPKMETIVKQVTDKLPSKIYISQNNNLDGDQENEREIEEMSQVVIVQAKRLFAKHEQKWDYYQIFEQDFIDKGCIDKHNSPNLKELKKQFVEVDITGIKGLEWHHSIYATQNFIQTVDGIKPGQGIFQNEFLKPANFVLIYKKTNIPYFILVSCHEASKLVNVLSSKKEIYDTCIIHIDDYLGGPSMVPSTFNALTQDQYNEVIVILRLFNGDSRFPKELIPYVHRSIGYIEETSFHQDPPSSIEIYSQLSQRNYIQNGFITMKLAKQLKRQVDRINHELENKYGLELTKQFNNIVIESIAELGNIHQLNVIMKELIKARGKMNLYQSSTLHSLFEKKL